MYHTLSDAGTWRTKTGRAREWIFYSREAQQSAPKNDLDADQRTNLLSGVRMLKRVLRINKHGNERISHHLTVYPVAFV